MNTGTGILFICCFVALATVALFLSILSIPVLLYNVWLGWGILIVASPLALCVGKMADTIQSGI